MMRSTSASMPKPDTALRSRRWLAVALVLVILTGLASRKFSIFPEVLANYPGDALWAAMVYAWLALIRPSFSTWRLAGWSLCLSFLVEFLQLYQACWISALRASTLGHLVLGNGFDWLDLIAYVVGISLAVCVDYFLLTKTSVHETH